jgi:hypothetical protein
LALAVAADPGGAAVLEEDLVDDEVLAHLCAGLACGVDEDRVEHGAAWAVDRVDALKGGRLPSRRTPFCSNGRARTGRIGRDDGVEQPLSAAAAPRRALNLVSRERVAGNAARSTTSTSSPLRASSIAVAEPATRAPTTITSNIGDLRVDAAEDRPPG